MVEGSIGVFMFVTQRLTRDPSTQEAEESQENCMFKARLGSIRQLHAQGQPRVYKKTQFLKPNRNKNKPQTEKQASFRKPTSAGLGGTGQWWVFLKACTSGSWFPQRAELGRRDMIQASWQSSAATLPKTSSQPYIEHVT